MLIFTSSFRKKHAFSVIFISLFSLFFSLSLSLSLSLVYYMSRTFSATNLVIDTLANHKSHFVAPFFQRPLVASQNAMRTSFLRSFVRNLLHENALGPCHRFYASVHREPRIPRRSHEAELEEWMELAFSIFAQSASP